MHGRRDRTGYADCWQADGRRTRSFRAAAHGPSHADQGSHRGVKGGLWTPNEARSRVDAAPLAGGDTVYLQQQYYSLKALAERDANAPFAKPPPPAVPAPDKSAEPETDDEDDVQRYAADLIAYVLQPASATP